eukprot:gene3799-2228_t
MIRDEKDDQEKNVMKRDVWSVGVTALELLTGKMPFWWVSHTKLGVMTYVGKLSGSDKVELPTDLSLSQNAYNFIQRCLVVEPRDRPTISELIDDPWFAEYNLVHRTDASNNRSINIHVMFTDLKYRFQAYR